MKGAWIAAAVVFAFPAFGQADLPDGPGKAAVVKVCSGCHSFTMFTQNHSSKDQWEAVVQDMVSRGAEGSDDEIDQVVRYLAAHFGPAMVNVNKATAEEIVKALAISKDDAGAIVQYRAKNGAFKNLAALESVPGIDAKKIEEKKDSIEY